MFACRRRRRFRAQTEADMNQTVLTGDHDLPQGARAGVGKNHGSVNPEEVRMLSKRGRSGLLRRVGELESRLTDHSRLPPKFFIVLKFWDRQIYNYMTDQEHVPLTIEAMRAIVHYSDDPASLVGALLSR